MLEERAALESRARREERESKREGKQRGDTRACVLGGDQDAKNVITWPGVPVGFWGHTNSLGGEAG